MSLVIIPLDFVVRSRIFLAFDLMRGYEAQLCSVLSVPTSCSKAVCSRPRCRWWWWLKGGFRAKAVFVLLSVQEVGVVWRVSVHSIHIPTFVSYCCFIIFEGCSRMSIAEPGHVLHAILLDQMFLSDRSDVKTKYA